MGGAQAVAAFAYGVEDGDDGCAPVDLVTGPGNIYVAAAKRLLKGVIGIDAEAGPTEIAVLADDSADAEHVAADLVSPGRARPARRRGAGHRLGRARGCRRGRAGAPRRRHQAHRAGAGRRWPARQSAIVLVDDVDAGLDRRQRVRAPSTSRSRPATPRRSPRGCATPGRSSSALVAGEPGRLRAGSNHVLPTGGCACHSSGLSVQSFLRGIHVVDLLEATRCARWAAHVVTLARAEDLPGAR